VGWLSLPGIPRSWPLQADLPQRLNLALPLECRAQNSVLDGEIVCLDETGTSQFRNLLFRRGEPRYYAFDLLFSNGEDLRYLPLADRKHRLHALQRSNDERLLYCDHIEGMGEELFHLNLSARP
jgi:bifunctional non-homologous end joining protein LigD